MALVVTKRAMLTDDGQHVAHGELKINFNSFSKCNYKALHRREMNQKYLSMSSNFKANMTIEMKTLLPSP
jgi:hypothetical protein